MSFSLEWKVEGVTDGESEGGDCMRWYAQVNQKESKHGTGLRSYLLVIGFHVLVFLQFLFSGYVLYTNMTAVQHTLNSTYY